MDGELGGRGAFPFILELFVTVLLTFNCAEEYLLLYSHTNAVV